VNKVSELQQQIAATQQERKRAEQLTSSYDGQMKKLKELHCQCQEDAGKLKALLKTKEAELSRMLTALQISAAQVCVGRIPPPACKN
jgi:predicted secreted protein